MNDIEQRLHELLDTPAPLAAWLAGRADDEVVGIAGDAGDCPIARLICHSISDIVSSDVCVDSTTVSVYGSELRLGSVRHRKWSSTFVECVDEIEEMQGRVTAATARDILSGIEVSS